MIKKIDFVLDYKVKELEEKAYIYLLSFCEIGNKENLFFAGNIEEFLEELKYFEEERIKIYTIDLKIFGEFLFSKLLKLGYTCVKDRSQRDVKTFSTLINEMGNFYSIEIYYDKKKNNSKRVMIYDIKNIINKDIRELSQDFLMKEYKKVNNEFEDINRNLDILEEVMRILKLNKIDKITIGSSALADYKEKLGDFYYYFPDITTEVHNTIKKAYKGGFCYVNPIYKSKGKGKGIVLDYNSMYPYVMKNKELPFGDLIYFEGEYEEDPLYNLYIEVISISFDLKQGKIPCIQIRDNIEYDPVEYLSSSGNDIVTITVTNIDLELIKENYDIHYIKYHYGFKMKSCVGLFDEYINYWSEKKEKAINNKNESVYEIAKAMQNMLYGKFGTNPEGRRKFPVLQDDGSISYAFYEKEEIKKVYLPVAIFTTSYAREKIIKDCEKVMNFTSKNWGYNAYLYSDTDSIHILLDKHNEEEIEKLFDLSNSELGKLKIEKRFTSCKYIKAKCYILCNSKENKIITKVSGMSKRLKDSKKQVKISLKNFKSGLKTFGKTKYKHVDGGVIKIDTEFEIR